MVSSIPSVNSETTPVLWIQVGFVKESNGEIATSLEQSIACEVAM